MSTRLKNNKYITLEVSGSQLICFSRKEFTGVKSIDYSSPRTNTVFRRMFLPVSSKLHASSICYESDFIARYPDLTDEKKYKSVRIKSKNNVQNIDVTLSPRKELKIPLVTYPCFSGDRVGKPSCLKKKPAIFQRQPQRSHTVALIPERFQVLCNANTLHELKKVLAIQGRFLNRIHSFPASIPQRPCVVNESLVALPCVYRLSKASTIPNNEPPTNVLAKSIETPSQPLPTARVTNHISPTAKLPRFQTTLRQSQKCFPDIDIDIECQCIANNKSSTSSPRPLQKLLNSFCKDSIHKHIQYLRNCHLQAEIIKKRVQSKQKLNLADSNDHLQHTFPACFCVEEQHCLDRNTKNSINNFSLGALSEEKQEKLTSLLDSLYRLRLDSADLKFIQIPKIVLTDYSSIGIKNAVQLSEVKWKREHFLKENHECKTNEQKSVDSKDPLCWKCVLRADRLANNNFLQIPQLRDCKY